MAKIIMAENELQILYDENDDININESDNKLTIEICKKQEINQ